MMYTTVTMALSGLLAWGALESQPAMAVQEPPAKTDDQAAKTPPKDSIDQKLATVITCEMTDMAVKDMLQFMRDFSGLNIVVGTEGRKAIERKGSLKVSDLPLRSVLIHLCRLSGTEWKTDGGAIVIEPCQAGSVSPVQPEDTPDDRGRATKTLKILNSEKKVSVDFQEAPLGEVIDFFREMTGLNCIVYPGVNDPAVTLRVQDMQLEKVLSFICKGTGAEWKIGEGGVICILPASKPKPPPESGKRIDRTGPEPVSAPRKADERDPAQDGLVARRLPKEFPLGVTLDKVKALIQKVSPKARIDYDADLQLLLVVSEEPVELRRTAALLRTLGLE